MFNVKTISRKIGEHEISLETGKIARQAGGGVVVRYAGNAMLVTACIAPEPSNGDFFPLTVHFQEKFYSVGRIPGGFFRREAKPSDNATLMARQIDRPIRPLFPEGFNNEVQIIVTLIDADLKYSTEALGILGAVVALAISPIPLQEYAGGVKVVWHPNWGYKINPSIKDIEESHLDMLVGGTKEGVCMVEGGASEVSEEIVLEALRIAQEAILEEIDMIEEFVRMINPEKIALKLKESLFTEEQTKEFKNFAYDKIKAVSNDNDKHRRSTNIKAVFTETFSHFMIDQDHEGYHELKTLLENWEVEIIRHQILVEKVRTDGRQLNEIRPINIELDLFPGLHGSALFTRGQTQSLGITTLGMPKDEMLIDSVESSKVFTKRFFLHYNFPPFSVGEVKRLGGLSRREIGHGYLAERALIPMIPDYEKFPYTIRFVSEITESNGSSSMASVCSGSLSMMAAGVPLKSPVAGIAMGLVWDKANKNYTVLSDIQGLEDHHGDMDFKVAGTTKGITAIQMDLKTAGLPEEIMQIALSQAKEGRIHILGIMNQTITAHRNQIADTAPKLHKMTIEPSQIGGVIGSGGRVIKKIMADFNTEISIEDNGNVIICGKDLSKIEETKVVIRHLTDGFSEDEAITAPVTRKEVFGVFLEILPGTQALLHTSKMKDDIQTISVGDNLTVYFKNIDDKKRYNVYQINKDVEEPRRERRFDRDRDRGGRRNDFGDKREHNGERREHREYGEKKEYREHNGERREHREYGEKREFRKDREHHEYKNKYSDSKPEFKKNDDNSQNPHKGHSPDSGF
ncbi:MAG: polyribonucleotide nucleotidyltransferase [Brevinema sp.]